MVPTDQQLRAAIGARRGRFAFAEQRVPRQVDTLIVAQCSRATNIIAIHYHFAQVVGQRRDAQRKSVAHTQTKGLGNFIGNGAPRSPPAVAASRSLSSGCRARSIRSSATAGAD